MLPLVLAQVQWLLIAAGTSASVLTLLAPFVGASTKTVQYGQDDAAYCDHMYAQCRAIESRVCINNIQSIAQPVHVV
jgi:hypothetical protein